VAVTPSGIAVGPLTPARGGGGGSDGGSGGVFGGTGGDVCSEWKTAAALLEEFEEEVGIKKQISLSLSLPLSLYISINKQICIYMYTYIGVRGHGRRRV